MLSYPGRMGGQVEGEHYLVTIVKYSYTSAEDLVVVQEYYADFQLFAFEFDWSIVKV